MLSQTDHRLSEIISHGDHKVPPVPLAQSLMLPKEKISFIHFSEQRAALEGHYPCSFFGVSLENMGHEENVPFFLQNVPFFA
jgi:hypothetical protein